MRKFLEYLEARLDSPKSVDLYYRAVLQALEGSDPLLFVEDESLGGSRRDTFRKALIHYARWKADDELLAALKDMRIPGRWKRSRVVNALTLDEWKRLQETIREDEKHDDGAMRAALLLLCTSGLRISELLDLTRETLEEALSEGKAITYQKGRTLRWYVIGTEEQWESSSVLLEAMTASKNQVWRVLAKDSKTKDTVGQSLRWALKRAAKIAGIGKKVNPHMLRRVAGDAVRKAARGDMKVVQDFLGHQSLKTTIEWYQDHSHPDEVAEALERI